MDTSWFGIPLLDFTQISVMFLLTMVVFFSNKGHRRLGWLNNFLLVVFAGQCVLVAVFRPGLNVKAFALLMLFSVLLVEGGTMLRRTSHQGDR